LEVERDEFWSWHWTFKSARLKKPQPLLGDARVTDLAVNVILPWLWTRAAEGKNEKLQRELNGAIISGRGGGQFHFETGAAAFAGNFRAARCGARPRSRD
jgi:hypothetical protein